ncbi:MAG: hypothetical protein ACKOX6_08595 [Bdellovibrio sp.]
MKLADIVNIIAKELGTADLKEINKLLKAGSTVKFRIAGKALGHFGFTGQIKSLSEEGVKAFMANKVSLIRLGDIETFEKAKPRTERPVRTPKAEESSTSPKAPVKPLKPDFEDEEEIEDGDDDDFEDLRPKKLKNSKAKPSGKSGSRFIPTAKKSK